MAAGINLRGFAFRREVSFRIRGEEERGELFVGELEERPDGTWLCHWSLTHVHPERGAQVGDDPLDAIYQCLRFVEELIKGSEQDGLIIWWRFRGDHAGFDFEG